MSKKSRVLNILAVVLCLCVSGFIGYHGGYTVGLYAGHIEGFTAGYTNAVRNPTMSNIEQSAPFASVEGSIARRQANQNYTILPLEANAFEPDQYDFELSELKWWTGHETFRNFYESFGIIITEESELSGWFACQLPEGWSISYNDTPNHSRDEAVYYIMPDGVEAFHIISHKDITDCAASLAPNLDLF